VYGSDTFKPKCKWAWHWRLWIYINAPCCTEILELLRLGESNFMWKGRAAGPVLVLLFNAQFSKKRTSACLLRTSSHVFSR